MLRAAYSWLVERAKHPQAIWWLCVISFAESSFCPLPPDIILVPMAIKTPSRMWWYSTLCSVASVVGGLFGYCVGYYLFQALGEPVIAFYHAEDAFGNFQKAFAVYGPWLLILKGITPVPYKLLAIAAGFAKLDFTVFLLCSLVARFSRYYMITALLWKFGPEVESFIERRLMLVTGAILAGILVGVVSLRLF